FSLLRRYFYLRGHGAMEWFAAGDELLKRDAVDGHSAWHSDRKYRQRQHHRPEPRRGRLQHRQLHDCGDFISGYDHCATDTATRSSRHFLFAIAFGRGRDPTLFLVAGLGSTSIRTFAIQLRSDFGHADCPGHSELQDES